jgi:hypothetical protein
MVNVQHRPLQISWAVVALGALFASGCGSSAANSTPGTDAGTSPDATIGDKRDSGDKKDSGESPTLGCASSLLCGSKATCCAKGDDCVAGACVAPCSSTTEVHCDGKCCGASQICFSNACVSPGASCTDSVDCSATEFCEPTLGKCLPEPPGGPACQYHPPASFDPILLWSWTTPTNLPDYNQVLSTPLVADVNGDGTPDMVVVSHYTGDGACDTGWGYLRLLNGKTGAEEWAPTVAAYTDAGRVAFCRTPALADIDGDGKPEIVAHAFGGGLIAFKGDGSILWTSTLADGTTPYKGYFGAVATIAIADMDGKGTVGIASGGVLFNAKGSQLAASAGREDLGGIGGLTGGNSLLADINGDGIADIVTGAAAFGADGSTIWSNGMSDGYTAIADFDGDGKPELVVISVGYARVHDAATGALLVQVKMPGTGNGGPPTIADFNGDGTLDFASAVGDSYTIFSFTKTPTPAIGVIWSVPTADISSSVTGSSVFDFDGDGDPDVLYNDQCYMRVYDGKTGNVLVQMASSSGTAANYPIAVDVMGDHHSELVVVSDDWYELDYPGFPNCAVYQTTGESYRHGVFVYGDKKNAWVRTRQVWNEHAYHVTNIGGTGEIPVPEPDSWGPSGLNTYRVSQQGNGTFNAPDLTVSLAVNVAGCPASVVLEATVSNLGSLGVASGALVQFYAGMDATGMLLGEGHTTQALLPGQSDVVPLTVTLSGPIPAAFFVLVNGNGAITECDGQNNGSTVGGASCTSAPK